MLPDADLDYAVEAAAFAAFFHQGQICMNARKVIIERPIYDVDHRQGRHRFLPHLD